MVAPGRRGISYWKKGKGKVIYFLKNVPFSPLPLDFATFSLRAAEITRMVVHEGYLVISGIEEQHAKGLSPLFEPLTLLRHRRLGDWHGFVFQKGPA
jgi:hypothetical protein